MHQDEDSTEKQSEIIHCHSHHGCLSLGSPLTRRMKRSWVVLFWRQMKDRQRWDRRRRIGPGPTGVGSPPRHRNGGGPDLGGAHVCTCPGPPVPVREPWPFPGLRGSGARPRRSPAPTAVHLRRDPLAGRSVLRRGRQHPG